MAIPRLVTNVLDNGGARLLTGLSSGDPTNFKLITLPFQFSVRRSQWARAGQKCSRPMANRYSLPTETPPWW